MLDIRTYMIEAVSSRANSAFAGGYTPFPQKRTNKEGIINWLLQNDFENIKTDVPESMLEHYNRTGNKCFYIGDYNAGNPLTEYISFFDGTNAFRILTCQSKDIPNGIEDCTIIKNNRIGKTDVGSYISFKEIRRYFEKA